MRVGNESRQSEGGRKASKVVARLCVAKFRDKYKLLIVILPTV